MAQVIVGKWGNDLAIRIPGEIVERCGLRDGERVEIEMQEGNLLIQRTLPRFTLDQLSGGKTPQEWQALYRGAFDWGPDRGREVVEE